MSLAVSPPKQAPHGSEFQIVQINCTTKLMPAAPSFEYIAQDGKRIALQRPLSPMSNDLRDAIHAAGEAAYRLAVEQASKEYLNAQLGTSL